jgi:SMC interacting uncharacterized protein involved in chromosome segregation
MNKTEFKVKALETIDGFYKEVENLERKKNDLSEKLKREYEKQLAVLNTRKAGLKNKLDAVENAAEAKREQAKEAYSEALQRYKTEISQLSKLFK